MHRFRPPLPLLFSLLVAGLLGAGLLGMAGCGQKGDLYLPDRADTPATLSPTNATK